MQKSYIIQTPVKNEEENLPQLIKSILEQSIKPSLWLIIDDGSTDSTYEIIKDAQNEHNWIDCIRLENRERDLGLHLSEVINAGISTIMKFCVENNIRYNYWGNIDADVTLDDKYFEKLINEFEHNPKLGVASGGTWYYKKNEIKHYDANIGEPSGGNMLVIKECLNDCGLPIPLTYSWDSVLKTKARINGWETKRFENIKSIDSRDVNAVIGYWKGSFNNGISAHFINMHPIHVFLKSLKISKKSPHYMGFAYALGYLYNLLWIKKKIDDESVKKYNWNKWRIKLNEAFKKC